MITFNISGLDEVRDKIASIDMDALCYKVASSLNAEIRNRVHVEGKSSDGSPIGKYSKGYMVVRTGSYMNRKLTNSESDSGYFTRGKNSIWDIKSKKAIEVKKDKQTNGSMRPKYNRDISRKVVLSLTRQMENDMQATQPIPIEGGYGIGYSNENNYDKAIWQEEKYGKSIWNLSEDEKQLAKEIINEYIDEINN
jgi:hypothetical protein